MDSNEYGLYEVGSLDGIIGNDHALIRLRNFAREANKGNIGMPLLVYGPTGTGKSASVRLLAKENGWNVVELNASDYRDGETIERRLLSAATSRSLMGRMNLILLDEIDEMASGFDRGAAAAIGNLISKSRNPVIFIANDMWDQSITFLRGKTDAVEFKKLQPDSVERILANIARGLSLNVGRDVMGMIANRSNGDARSAINDLSVIMGSDDEDIVEVIGLRDRKVDIFHLLDRIFTTNTFAAPLRAVAGTDLTNDMLIKWIDENIPKRYRYSDDLYAALDSLAVASTFSTRAMRAQHYAYWRYMNVMMSSGIALAKSHQPEARTAYSFPRVIKDLSASKAARSQERQIAEKLQRVFHTSTSNIIRGEMSMLSRLISRAVSKGNASIDEIKDQMMSMYQLEGKEVDYMLGRNS